VQTAFYFQERDQGEESTVRGKEIVQFEGGKGGEVKPSKKKRKSVVKAAWGKEASTNDQKGGAWRER